MKDMRSRKNSVITFICFSVLFLASAGVNAATYGLFNTGVDDSGIVLSVGADDPHYTVTVNGITDPAIRINPYQGPPNWITLPANIATTAAWIGPGDISKHDVDEDYTYTLEFDLGGSVPTNFAILGSWASDNASSIWLNGVDTGFKTPAGQAFNFLHDFNITETSTLTFNPGINTLRFLVTNFGSPGEDNPTGLLVANIRAVPIPGAVWLMGSGLLCFVALRRAHRLREARRKS